MTPRELADALERIAPHLHTLGVAEPCAIEAAQTLRALETERATARAEQAEAERDELRARFAEMTTKADAWSYAARALERADQAEAERDRYRSALRDVAREWPYLDLIDPQAVQECDLRGLVEYLLSAVRSEQRVAREALEGQSERAARLLRGDERTRNVRVMRVYRRTR